MRPELHRRAKEILLAALELEERARGAWVERACAGDADLAQEVRSLLEHGDAETKEFSGLFEGVLALGKEALRERFPPGELVAGRYEILRRLGAGGMGEVHLALDHKLGERVALKFLPPALARNPAWLERLVAEARLARGVTHPNVCRVHDVGEAGGESFLTMEYVEGEDLASWLRRAGPIPPARLRSMARELCAALAALHQQGVLHRDLKPGNVLVDREGRLRVADFGLAASLEEAAVARCEAGSPAYMAPELLRGGAPSVQSDLFSLGLVLFELAARRRPYGQASAVALAALHRDPPPSPGAEIDPVLERVIRRCLDIDPARRPDSALRLEAALSKEDPLAAVLELGELPSPRIIAASGARGLLGRGGALGLFVGFLLLLALFVPYASRTLPVQRAAPPLAPRELTERARSMLGEIAGTGDERASAQGYTGEEVLGALGAGGARWILGEAGPGDSKLRYWFRRGDEELVPSRAWTLFYDQGRTAPADPPLHQPGTWTLVLDIDGRLLLFAGAPRGLLLGDAGLDEDRWLDFFELAGLDPARFERAASELPIETVADQRVAWSSRDAEGPLAGLRVEAGSLGGAPVLFALLRREPATPGGWSAERRSELSASIYDAVLLLLLVISIPMAWRNLLTGRGDPWGATRLAIFTLLLRFATWVLRASHLADVSEELTLLIVGTASGLFDALTAWVLYMAVEPLVRREWPRVLVSWSRVLQGRLADPLVASHALIGSVAGVLLAMVFALDSELSVELGTAGGGSVPSWAVEALAGLASWLAVLPGEAVNALTNSLVLLTLLAVARLVLRGRAPALAAAVVVIGSVDVLAAGDPAVSWLTIGIGQVLCGYLVLVRFGVLAYAVALFVEYVLEDFPITLELGAWYGGSTPFALAVVIGIAAGAVAVLAVRRDGRDRAAQRSTD